MFRQKGFREICRPAENHRHMRIRGSRGCRFLSCRIFHYNKTIRTEHLINFQKVDHHKTVYDRIHEKERNATDDCHTDRQQDCFIFFITKQTVAQLIHLRIQYKQQKGIYEKPK